MYKTSSNARVQRRPSVDHVAIIMDGNGRWANKRKLPRAVGHQRGVEAVREVVSGATKLGIKYLTLFAFSTENWRRPPEEVTFLMNLFLKALEKEVKELHTNNIRLRVVGDRSAFGKVLGGAIENAENMTIDNDGLNLTIAANYGGRWDVVQAMNLLYREEKTSNKESFSEEDLSKFLSLNFAPDPDLFIRTGGEERISNFMLWQMAYTEFFFTDELWPDFNENSLKQAINSFRRRTRRFGGVDTNLESEIVA